MQIFQSYTGSAFLNNALQTIEALDGLDHVSEITTETLLRQYEKLNLPKLNKRLKSYTMVFTRNGPLYNDKNNGEDIYDLLMKKIVNEFEKSGELTCEISGLKFNKSFEQFFIEVLKELSFSEKDISKKDTSLNRCWYPLIGALGSDAQALPQAKFAINIHPICVAILQFLPQSSVLYKGGVLLLDSTNFDFTREYIKENCETIQELIQSTPKNEQVKNHSFGNKGSYVKMALEIHNEKLFDEDYSDLNLWSFTNSGTGASCSVERIPNYLFSKLSKLRETASLQQQADEYLVKFGDGFLDKLSGNLDFFPLYPSKKFEGASVDFFNTYQKLIGNEAILPYAELAAHLVSQYNEKGDDKVLKKKDAYGESDYPVILLKALIKGAKNGEWDFKSHIFILDDPNNVPVKTSKWRVQRIIHFYYLKNTGLSQNQTLNPKIENTKASQALALLVQLIENDKNKDEIIRNILNPHSHQNVSIYNIFIRASATLNLPTIYHYFFKDFQIQKFGVLELLRIYYSQKNETSLPEVEEEDEEQGEDILELRNIREFVNLYCYYYQLKYGHENKFPLNKFSNHVVDHLRSIKSGSDFYRWLMDSIENMTNFYKERRKVDFEDRSAELEQLKNYPDKFLYNQEGKSIVSFSRFAINFYLNQYLQEFKTKKSNSYESAIQ